MNFLRLHLRIHISSTVNKINFIDICKNRLCWTQIWKLRRWTKNCLPIVHWTFLFGHGVCSDRISLNPIATTVVIVVTTIYKKKKKWKVLAGMRSNIFWWKLLERRFLKLLPKTAHFLQLTMTNNKQKLSVINQIYCLIMSTIIFVVLRTGSCAASIVDVWWCLLSISFLLLHGGNRMLTGWMWQWNDIHKEIKFKQQRCTFLTFNEQNSAKGSPVSRRQNAFLEYVSTGKQS